MNKDFQGRVARQAQRMRRARRGGQRWWSALALVGSVGWIVVLPTVLGAWGGRWLDNRLDSGLTFTLGLLVLGLASGVYTTWWFVLRELL